ncbi:MAG: DNA polymerase III subunit delta [Bacillota bacterium]
MRYEEFIHKIEQGQVAPLYLVYGDESYLRVDLTNRLKTLLLPPEIADFNLDVLSGEDLDVRTLISAANTLPVMAPRRLVLVKETSLFRAGKKNTGKGKEAYPSDAKEADISPNNKDEALLLEYLQEPCTSTCLVFIASGKVDMRRKVYKALTETGEVVELAPLKGQDLDSWMRDYIQAEGKRANRESLAFLAAVTGGNLGLLAGELRKICLYLGETAEITMSDVEKVVSRTIQVGIFQLLDAVSERRADRAIAALREMLLTGEPPVRIAFMLARQFRLLLQAKLLLEKGYRENQLAGAMSVHPYEAAKVNRQCRIFTVTKLEKTLADLLELDASLKTGRGNARQAMELTLLEICRDEKNNLLPQR